MANMRIDRRGVLKATSGAVALGSLVASDAEAARRRGPPPRLRRIATEEAWSTTEHATMLRQVTANTWSDLDAINIRNLYGPAQTERAALPAKLVDVQMRLEQMDALGVDMSILSLTAPGVQIFDADTAEDLARKTNDAMARIVQDNPLRFAGLAAMPPQNPTRAVKEMERAILELKLNGFLINSHTQNEYLDAEKYWPIFEAAEALNAPIYLHPRPPSEKLAGAFRDIWMHAGIWGFTVETGTHAMRILLSGALDRFPKLRLVLGHMGENIPYHLWRSDSFFMRRPQVYKTKMKPSEAFKKHFWITNSGIRHSATLKYAIEVLGYEKIMWAIDYPFEEMEPAVKFMDEVDIPSDIRSSIYHKTAEFVFNIPPMREL